MTTISVRCSVILLESASLRISSALQKPLRRINIEEVSGTITVPEEDAGVSRTLVQEVLKEAEDGSSPLSSSPSAKMIKIEEIADDPPHSSDQ